MTRFIRMIGVLAVLAAMALAAGPLAAQSPERVIEQIRVEGNQRIEAETVRAYLQDGGIAVGDEFDRERIDRAFKTLFETGLFADISLRREAGTLVVSVLENPIINRRAFEGNSRLSDEELALEVELRPRVVYTRSRVQSDVARLLEVYRRSGRFAATVEAKVIHQAQNRVDLVFEINEGPLTGIRKISFIGNSRLSDRTLKRKIRTKESRWYCLSCFLTGEDTYDPDRLTFDRELLRRFYRSKGYADFRVISVVAELTRDRSGFFVTFALEEGERYHFGAVKIENNIRGLEVKDLFKHVRTKTGKLYNDNKVEETIQKLTNEVGNAGFAFVDVERAEDRDRESRTITITYKIGEGSRSYVERINISGNFRTRDEVIRREMRLVEGDAFNSAKLRRSQQRIRNLGFFDKVDVTRVRGTSPDKLVIDVDLAERPTGQIQLGAGFSSLEGPLADISLSEQNLLGRGQQLRLSFRISGQQQLLDLGFTEPYFLGRDLAAGFDVFRRLIDVTGEDDFDRESIGFALRAGYPLTDRIRHRVEFGLKQDTITGVSGSSSPFITTDEGGRVTSSVGQTLSYDVRDNRFEPTEGYVIRLNQMVAGAGGDVNFLRHRISGTYYRSITETWVGSLAASFGNIFGFSGDDVRLSDRFFVGGRSFRGFDSSGIGPRDACTDQALGGNIRLTGTAAVSFPLGLAEELNFRGRLFTDVGTLTQIDQADPGTSEDPGADPVADGAIIPVGNACAGFVKGVPRLLDEASLRASAGFGISFVSPLGPMQLDFAWPLLKEDFDVTKVFTFSFGTRF